MSETQTPVTFGDPWGACPRCSTPPFKYVYHNGAPCPIKQATIIVTCTDRAEHNRIIIAPIENEENRQIIKFEPMDICKYCRIQIDYGGVYHG